MRSATGMNWYEQRSRDGGCALLPIEGLPDQLDYPCTNPPSIGINAPVT
jgi:hypothetical protein